MGVYIENAVRKEQEIYLDRKGENIADCKAFSYALLKYFYDVTLFEDQDGLVTDAANDGGIDFIYFDDDNNKLIICQSKFTTDLSYESIITELSKMHSTVENFKITNTGAYNEKLRCALQNAIDRLPDEDINNIDYVLFTTATVNEDELNNRLLRSNCSSLVGSFSVYSEAEIESQIQETQEMIETVEEAVVKIDQPNHFISYNSDTARGVLVNLSSCSLKSLYNRFARRGLFDLNIRKYVKHKIIDGNINNTLENERQDFWFLNNGITIACESFDISDDQITIRHFSIVNGGQTTTLIGKYSGNNTDEFYIPCKIVCENDNLPNENDPLDFFTRIAEATNSQKQIYPRDLKSNSIEMRRLKNWLRSENILLEIKRGEEYKRRDFANSIKNDTFAQAIYSMVNQKPGTSRSNKKSLFEEPAIYNSIFGIDYHNDPNKWQFVLDLIDFHTRYVNIETQLKQGGLNPMQTEVLKNGIQIIFAMLGVVYMLKNQDISWDELNNNTSIVQSVNFVYGGFVSNYAGDDTDEKIRSLVETIVTIVTEAYEASFNNNQATSVSNYFKSDAKYYDSILRYFCGLRNTTLVREMLEGPATILSRTVTD